MKKKILVPVIVLTLSISITILLCNILKKTTDDSGIIISKKNISVNCENVKIKNLKDEMFMPLFFKNNSVVGKVQSTLTDYNTNDFEKSYPCNGCKSTLYSLDNKNTINETTLTTSNGISSIGSKNKLVRQSEDGKIHYINYDKSDKEITLDNYIEPYNGDLNNSTIAFLDGNDNYLVTYTYSTDENLYTTIKIYDINEKKLYTSDNLEYSIYNIFFIKEINSIMAIDNSGQLYKITLSDNKINIEKNEKLTLDSLENNIGYNSVKVINDSEILILNRNSNININNIITKYNFKTKKTTPLLNINEIEESIWVADINADGSLIVLEKGINNVEKGLVVNQMYLAKIKNDSLDVFYKNPIDNNTFNSYSIDDNGTSIFVTTTSWDNKDHSNTYSYEKYSIK
ncbi:putative membrane protein [Clostridium bornimense]|uniref:Putative membrane protein n=1 Tax=Clostridium bornimense TaxID=1216932 RepID=W6S177_9CLOT|nr:hypothetical protein [Clostridium bornimense]CDM70478.1 putative membrane protein [Clostridium bornimense]